MVIETILVTLLGIASYLIWIVTAVLIVQFVLSLLISFNVVNLHNQFVAALWHAVNVLLDPLLNPIRRRMPDTGGIDFSPMVLIIIMKILSDYIIPATVSLL